MTVLESIDKHSEGLRSETELNERGWCVIHGLVRLGFVAFSHSLSDVVPILIWWYLVPHLNSHYFLPVSYTFYPFAQSSLLPSSRLGAALSGPPVSEFSRRDHRGFRNDVWLQSWRRAPVDGELESKSASESVLCVMWTLSGPTGDDSALQNDSSSQVTFIYYWVLVRGFQPLSNTLWKWASVFFQKT